MQPVYLICGVSGAGKTWVCTQLQDLYAYVPHDEHYNDHASVVHQAAQGDRPVVTECPFGERLLRAELENIYGLTVIPFFVINDPDIIAAQYHKREGKPISKAAYTRAHTIMKRVEEWKAFHGTSMEVLQKLKGG